MCKISLNSRVVKRLIAINRILNKSLCFHKIYNTWKHFINIYMHVCVCVYIYKIIIHSTHSCIYVFKKYLHVYTGYMFIYSLIYKQFIYK